MEKEKSQPPLLLISHHQGDYEKLSFYSLLEKGNISYGTTNIPKLKDKYILGFHYGWLVLFNNLTYDCCLWNPMLNDTIELPELGDECVYTTCVLSKPPTDPDCRVLINCFCSYHQSFLKIGDEEFEMQDLQEENTSDIKKLLAMSSFHGNIYGLVETRTAGDQLVTIHFVGETDLEFKPILMEDIPQPSSRMWISRPWVTSHDNYLIESPCGGELLWVYRMYSYNHEHEFRVFRVDTNQMECVELETLGERTIFLNYSGTSGYCCSCEGYLKPNAIYYLDEDGILPRKKVARNLNVYDLSDKSITSVLPCPASHGRNNSQSFWIDPHVIHEFVS